MERSKLYLTPSLLDADRRRREELQAENAKEARRRERVEQRAQRAREKAQAKEASVLRRRERAAEKERLKALKAADRIARSCRACERTCRNPASSAWLWCDHCDVFGVRPERGLCPVG